jgi:hypothetical protein
MPCAGSPFRSRPRLETRNAPQLRKGSRERNSRLDGRSSVPIRRQRHDRSAVLAVVVAKLRQKALTCRRREWRKG